MLGAFVTMTMVLIDTLLGYTIGKWILKICYGEANCKDYFKTKDFSSFSRFFGSGCLNILLGIMLGFGNSQYAFVLLGFGILMILISIYSAGKKIDALADKIAAENVNE